ncbi:MAG: hypothetical protein J6V22_05775 [Clostridia bacterium]|nr:hypothetical protein [Clostridia bacterium]
MKRYIALFLCFITVFSLCSCNAYEKIFSAFSFSAPTASEKTETAEQQTTPEAIETTPEAIETTTEQPIATEEPETTTQAPEVLKLPQLEGNVTEEPTWQTNVFGSYEEILDVYRLAIERFDLIYAPTYEIAFALGFSNVEEVEWFEAILMSSYTYYQYDGRDERDASWDRLYHFTYAQTDLNGDRIEELLLLTRAQDVLAIFSTINGSPVLLGNYTPLKACEIDAQGQLHVTEVGSRNSYSKSVYEIAKGGKGLNKIVEYGVDDLLIDYPGYYVESFGKKTCTSKEDFDWLEETYGTYNTVWYSTLRLFSSTRILRAMYQPAILGEVQIYFADTGEYLYLKDYTPPRSTVPLYKRQELKCSFGNFDAEQTKMIECVIYYGDYLLLEYDYINDTVSARSLTDKEKLYAQGGVYRPLPAPWREKDISPEDIRKSIPGYWDVYNGMLEKVGSITFQHNIDVTLTPDESGYYLVTWQKEHSPLSCSCLDCEFGIKHKTLVYKQLLIHAKTGEIIEVGVSPERAKEIAAAYWNTCDGGVDHAAGSTYVMRIVIDGKPEYTYGGMYYHVVWQMEHYSSETYQNGGKPNYAYDYGHLYVHTQTGECYLYPSDGK